MNRKALTALLLVIAMLLTGCSFRLDPPARQHPSRATRPTAAPTEPTEAPEPPDLSDYSDLVDYGDIAYERPDEKALQAQIKATAAMFSDGSSNEEILAALEALETSYDTFSTMSSVAYLEYCKNLSDTYYESEYNLLEKENSDLQASMEELYIAAAQSDDKAYWEQAYFGEGSLDFYLTHRIYANEAFVALAQQETDLVTAYMNLQDSPTVVIDGKEQDFQALTEQYADDYEMLYSEIYPAYYEKYNAEAGKIYIDLIKLRRRMAQVAGYDSYQDYMYEFYYERDYTPAMARDYIAALCDTIAPLFPAVSASVGYASYREMDMDEVTRALNQTLYQMDEEFYRYFHVMQNFHLWDSATSSSKMPGSFETYLGAYDEPFVYISPEGTESDYMTLAHEFGHFVDSMHSEGEQSCIDTAEIFSQGLEFLSLFYSDLPEDTVSRLRKLKLQDTYYIFLFQAAYADFEDRVYQLSDKELTLDAINDTYEAVMRDYGQYVSGMDWYNTMAWIDINHFFSAPFYVISYCTSADVALQLYQMEADKTHDGLDIYRMLLDAASEDDFLQLLEACNLQSPFASDRAQELADYFSTCFDD